MEMLVETTLQNSTPMAWVIVIILAMFIHHLIGWFFKFFGEWLDHKRGNGLQGSIRKLQTSIEALRAKVADNPPYPACHYDPQHYKRIESIETDVAFVRESQEEQRRQIDSGKFTCKVHGDHLKTIQRLGDKLIEGR